MESIRNDRKQRMHKLCICACLSSACIATVQVQGISYAFVACIASVSGNKKPLDVFSMPGPQPEQ